jgi:hypothetical protein
MFPDRERPLGTLRRYSDVLTADVNRKGVLDVDVVKGCSAGLSAHPDGGCYGACYAAKIAKFRGIDFSVAVTRTVQSREHRLAIERSVESSPFGFFRVGTMGDPCHDWEKTVETVEWLSTFARAVIITKHWRRATDDQLARLIACRAVLNTSLSALDTAAELAHRKGEFKRFQVLGGDSVARIVSCDFDRSHPDGERMGATQDGLFRLAPTLDNPLRLSQSHQLVTGGLVRVSRVRDLGSLRYISLANHSTYLGHCRDCPDLCGIALTKPHSTQQRQSTQMALWKEEARNAASA